MKLGQIKPANKNIDHMNRIVLAYQSSRHSGNNVICWPSTPSTAQVRVAATYQILLRAVLRQPACNRPRQIPQARQAHSRTSWWFAVCTADASVLAIAVEAFGMVAASAVASLLPPGQCLTLAFWTC